MDLVSHHGCEPCRATQRHAHNVTGSKFVAGMSRYTPHAPQKDPVAPVLPPQRHIEYFNCQRSENRVSLSLTTKPFQLRIADLRLPVFNSQSALPTHTPLIKGVEVHPLNRGDGVSKTTSFTIFWGPTTLNKWWKCAPLIKGVWVGRVSPIRLARFSAIPRHVNECFQRAPNPPEFAQPWSYSETPPKPKVTESANNVTAAT